MSDVKYIKAFAEEQIPIEDGISHLGSPDANSIRFLDNRKTADNVPPSEYEHPLNAKIQAFLRAQTSYSNFEATGLNRTSYLQVIDSQISFFRQCLNDSGVIIDPVERKETGYATPCYALSVAVLQVTGYNRDPGLLESGIKTMDAAISQMHEHKTVCGDFFIYPIMLAYSLYSEIVPAESMAVWKQKLSEIDPEKLYTDTLCKKQRRRFGGNWTFLAICEEYLRAARSFSRANQAELLRNQNTKFGTWNILAIFSEYVQAIHYKRNQKRRCGNWNLLAVSGEYLRSAQGLTTANQNFIEKHLEYQAQYFTPLGMYRDPGCPLAYDHLPRSYIAGMLHWGYHGASFTAYRDLLFKGAWTSLFMMSPFGEAPTGYRSSHHIWNEAQSAVTYEIYAKQYLYQSQITSGEASAEALAKAGAFKRAAHLSLACIQRWIRPDGSGYIVKNRYPIESRHGYEDYSYHSKYNLWACSMLAAAYLYADESIVESPCPADVGGFVVPIMDGFHKVFANASGTYVEYETYGNHSYNPAGLIRVHIKGGNPQLGPSDGTVQSGENLCIGPAWQDQTGTWHRLADYNLSSTPQIDVLEETAECVRFRLTFEINFRGINHIQETVTVEPAKVTVEDELEGEITGMRIFYPMLVFDGAEKTQVLINGSSVKLTLRGASICFTLLSPSDVELKRTGKCINHRNGEVEAVYGDIQGKRCRYQLTSSQENV